MENRLTWRDDRLAKPVDVVFDDCGVEVSNLALFGDPARHERTTATVKAWSRAQDVVKDIAVSGTITTKPGPLDLALEITGKASGITAVRLQPYIDPTGIQEQLQEAAISGSGRCNSRRSRKDCARTSRCATWSSETPTRRSPARSSCA